MSRLAPFQLDRHPMIASLDADETWGWCYVDRRLLRSDARSRLPKRKSALRIFLGRFFKNR